MKSLAYLLCATTLALISPAANAQTDRTPPTVGIRYPAAGARVRTSPINIVGSASDLRGLDHIEVFTHGDSIYSGASLAVDGTTNWTSEPIELIPGTNTVWARAFDTAGNVSSLVKRSFFYVVPSTLTLAVNGLGTIGGVRDQATLEIGRRYYAYATPGRGQVLVNWTDGNGVVLGTNAQINFLMQDSMLLVANFTTNLFMRFKGNYSGLFMNPYDMQTYSAGAISLDLTGKSTFTGKILQGKSSFPFYGQFTDNEDGTASADLDVSRGTNTPLTLHLVLSTDPAAPGLSGEIYGEEMTPDAWSIPWTGTIAAQYSKWPARRPLVGRYNMVVQPLSGDDSAPGGCGFGSAILATNGQVTLSLTLADSGALVSYSSMLGRDGTFPFYSSLYANKGMILGWLAFTNQPGTDISDYYVTWVKPASYSRYYNYGFNAPVKIFGARFVSPLKGQNAMRWTAGEISAGAGNLDYPIQYQATFNPLKNQFSYVTDLGTNTVTFSPISGRITGRIVLGPSLPAKTFTGVMTAKTGGMMGPLPSCFGFFLGQSQSGYVVIGPR